MKIAATRKKSMPTKARTTRTATQTNKDPLLRIEALLKRVEEQAERAKKRVELLEEFIRNEVFPRVGNPIPALVELVSVTHPHLPPSPPSSPAQGPLPGIGLDLSQVQDEEIK